MNRLFVPPTAHDVEHNIWVTAQGFPMAEDGEVKFILGTLTDVSHRKWAESVQARSTQKATDAKRQQEEIIDMTSHEMSNPLSAIHQFASLISNSMDGFGTDSYALFETLTSHVDAAKTILICAAHQKRMINDVLISNRLEHMKLSVTPVPVKIPDLIRNISNLFQVELDADVTSLKTIQDPSFDMCGAGPFLCDSSRLTQIFTMNLISNALKFTRGRALREIVIRYGAGLEPPGEDTATMTDEHLYWSPETKQHRDLTVDKEWGQGEVVYLRFSVQDTGPGLEPDELQRLFNRSSQANARTHITYGGAGLGLYISRELAEMQGGRMGVASTAGVGTTIAFYIKTRRAESMDIPLSQQIPITTANVVTTRQESQLPEKIRLLLVEDNLVNQKLLQKQLERLGCEVHVANHGIEALDFLKTTAWYSGNGSTRIDLILMDWEMPVMDGLTCSKRIRSLEQKDRTEHLPIIAITAKARQEQLQLALDAGMDGVITKPFLVPELMVKVRKWVVGDGG